MKLITINDIHAYVELEGDDETLVPETPIPSDIEIPESF